MAVQHRDLPLALGQALQQREREPVDLGPVLALDQHLDGRRERAVGRLDRRVRHVDGDLALHALAHLAELAVRRRAQPDVDLAHRLPGAPARGASARLLKRLLDLLARRAAVPRRHRRAQLLSAPAAGDLLEQCARRLRARTMSGPCRDAL